MAGIGEIGKIGVIPNDPLYENGFGLYVHWPFCLAKCPYCDFNSHVQVNVEHDRWRSALLRELVWQIERFEPKARLTSIFFGGGTPSLMPPATVTAVIDRARECLGFSEDIEITLEANPTSVEARNFEGYAAAGVNRLSLGVQSLDDDALRFLGRQHDTAEAIAAIELAKQHFPRMSFDLIYARTGQTPQSWRDELECALDYAIGHIALYQLTIEPGTRFHAAFRAGKLPVLANDAQAELFELTVRSLEARGYRWYEISNFARFQEESRHNLVYWRYAPYLGIGPGAHGRVVRRGVRYATSTRRAPEDWLRAVERDRHGLLVEEPIGAFDAAVEALMMGLRLEEGLPISRVREILGDQWRSVFDWPGVDRAVRAGMLRPIGDRLVATPEGRVVLDALLTQIVGDGEQEKILAERG